MRIVSLLPSLTELVCALGRGDELVGVTHECDFPPGVEFLPHLTRSRIPAEADERGDRRDGRRAGGEPLRARRRGPGRAPARPDPDPGAVRRLRGERGDRPPGRPRACRASPAVESVNPTDLDGRLRHVPPGRRPARRPRRGRGADRAVRGDGRAGSPAGSRAGRSPRVLVLEWLDPPFSSGHWNPEIVALAGGREVIGRAGRAVAAARPGTRSPRPTPRSILVAACGFSIDRAEAELAALADRRRVAGPPGRPRRPGRRDRRLGLLLPARPPAGGEPRGSPPRRSTRTAAATSPRPGPGGSSRSLAEPGPDRVRRSAGRRGGSGPGGSALLGDSGRRSRAAAARAANRSACSQA